MIIYPAIDLKDGKCVRLHKGDMASETIYNNNPAAQAMVWAQSGFSWIHIVDLNGAIEGKPVNANAVQSIIDAVDLPLQLGGGIRDLKQIETWLYAGVSRVILGTVAVKNPALVKEACLNFPGQIAIGADAYGDDIATEGWVEKSGRSVIDLIQEFEDDGLAAVIYTDINRDGTGEGLNMENTIKLAESISIPVIASGGVGSLKDVEAVKAADKVGIEGMIIGKALYDGRINPLEALRLAA
ncbi:MAG: 1-(5-phosphoribosyl)-5-[(5-phosphoribosylamino)methylideneamino]imidazole-4-carboxamide isomerase [Alphaproteobacteria bacterium]|nr:1-(5-phosphoribosyl)-5-[(5-phosphoribosylamino)methylideneamino]imidazole-4-carboxamide isomerase [Alphaproteobacteria bacterium]NCQ88495.1 1-(5-phosphoribosyl)-5-[(5-phosphoribosylamino)methylideneamino]imidazole-4-carboxamide isomerase [Alphaproteobacteria bacterium]NCT06038.1 1-(5-phosphoribosyl)-5-[(5-phosphoribosylamino)methylideneamino]imidazole-4-carboxamide isomerase [Alphaproteobacteria bacterium]